MLTGIYYIGTINLVIITYLNHNKIYMLIIKEAKIYEILSGHSNRMELVVQPAFTLNEIV